MQKKLIAVVTGANRGLGKGVALELAQRGYKVICLSRKPSEIKEFVNKLDGEALELDLENQHSVEACAKLILEKFPDGIDVLVNNAGVLLDREGWSYSIALQTMVVNALAPLYFTRLLEKALQKRSGCVINVSSGMGQLSEMGPGFSAYRLSKTALNAVTKNLAEEWRAKRIRVNSVCPGWVKTDMGGSGADREISQGVASILFPISSEETAGFFRDGKRLDW